MVSSVLNDFCQAAINIFLLSIDPHISPRYPEWIDKQLQKVKAAADILTFASEKVQF